MKNKLFFFLALFIYHSFAFSQVANHVTVWPTNQLPIQVTIDNLYLPNNIPNTTTNRNGLIIGGHEWNDNVSLGPLLNITEGFVNNDISDFPSQDGRNEIKFGSWPPGQSPKIFLLTHQIGLL